MDTRKEEILKEIINFYIKTGEPVSSGTLSVIFKLSPATIRNEMAVLEKDGYIYHPHISAGRIPTTQGYRYYIDNLLSDYSLSRKTRNLFNRYIAGTVDFSTFVREIANVSQSLVLFTENLGNVNYIGLSYLFSQPELYDKQIIYKLSLQLDNLEDIVIEIQSAVVESLGDVFICVGQENPIHHACSLMATTYGDNNDKVLALVGTTRINYAQNLAILDMMKDVFNHYSNTV